MKWSITQLRKYQDKPFEFHQTVNFDHLKETLDLIDLSDITIDGELIINSNEVTANMHITGNYTLPCARTLKPVEVALDTSSQEIFDLDGYYADSEENEHYHDASDGMINLKDIAEELVIIEKPMRVFADDSEEMMREGNGWEVLDEEQAAEHAKEQEESESKQIDPRLQKLHQLYDEEQ